MGSWLRGVLAAVYSKDGLIGVAVIAGLLILALYLFGDKVTVLLGL